MHAITGITGQVGGSVAEFLLSAGKEVRAVARDPVRAAPWVARGCSLALAEMTDATALAGAFHGAEGVFILIPPNFDPSPDFREVRAVVAAVRTALAEARPGRVVCLSTVGVQSARPNLLGQLGIMERDLGTLDLPIAFLRAAWFMENAAGDVEDARAGAIRSFLQPLERAIPMVATADIGSTAARLLCEPWPGRRIVELQGPVPVSPKELAVTFAELLGRPVEAAVVSRPGWEALFLAQGMRNPQPRIQMLDGFNAGWLSFEKAATTEAVVGTTPAATVLAGLLARV